MAYRGECSQDERPLLTERAVPVSARHGGHDGHCLPQVWHVGSATRIASVPRGRTLS